MSDSGSSVSAVEIPRVATALRNKNNGTSICDSMLVPIILVVMLFGVLWWWWYVNQQERQMAENGENSYMRNRGKSTNEAQPNTQPQPPAPQQDMPKQVVDLTGAQAKELSSRVPIFIAFVSEGCGHCVNMKPEYHRAATMTKVPIHTLYASRPDARDLLSEFNIMGFPTMCWIYQGKVLDEYRGPRTAESISEFVNKRVGDDKGPPKGKAFPSAVNTQVTDS